MEEILKIFLNENLLDDIKNIMSDPDEASSSEKELKWSKDDKTLAILNADDEYALVLSIKKPKQNKEIKDFFEFAQNLDDDIFIKAVELYTKKFGDNSLKIFNNLLAENDLKALPRINQFKEIVNEIVTEEVNKLQKFLTVIK